MRHLLFISGVAALCVVAASGCRQTARTGAEQETTTATSRDLLGRAYRKEIAVDAAPKPAPQPQDSLSALEGGWLKGKTEEAKKETEKTAKNKTMTADNRNSGNASKCSTGYCAWYDAVDYCKERGGLPDINALKNMFNAGCTGERQSDSCDKCYWSSEEESAGYAWNVDFYDGNVYYDNEYGNFSVRCAR